MSEHELSDNTLGEGGRALGDDTQALADAPPAAAPADRADPASRGDGSAEDSGAGPGDGRHADGRHADSPWLFWRSVALTLAVALGIRQFLVEARYIPSGSMLPGLQLQDRLLVEKLTYRSRLPRRGEIVVFRSPHSFDPVLASGTDRNPLRCLLVNIPFLGSLPGLSNPACDAYIKRVVALPGEEVAVNPRGEVFIDGRRLEEPYVSNYCPVDDRGMGPCRPLKALVPPGHVLTLGDNRANSWDGRFWPGGPFLPANQIIGRAFWRFYPISQSGTLLPPESGDPATSSKRP